MKTEEMIKVTHTMTREEKKALKQLALDNDTSYR